MKQKNRGADAPAFSSIIPSIVDPRVFRKLESLCSIAIKFGDNHPQVREAIASLNIEMRKVSGEHYGHDSIDVTTLTQLLKRTDPNKPIQHQQPAPMRDPIDVLELNRVLDSNQVNAADSIRTVWQAFGRCLTVSGRGYDRGGGSMRRATALQPLDVMGDDTWALYKETFVPWYTRAKEQKVGCKVTGNVTKLQIVFRVVIDEYFPEAVDKFLFLEDGTSLKVLRGQLSRFFNPEPFVPALAATDSGDSGVRMVDGTTPVAQAA